MKRAYPHTETLQVPCITPPYGTHAFTEILWTSKPASRVELGSQKSKNLRTIPNTVTQYVGGGTACHQRGNYTLPVRAVQDG